MVRLSDRNQTAIQHRIQEQLHKANIDILLLTEETSIYYATGHYSSFQKQATQQGYCVAVCPAEGEFTIIMPDFEMLPGKPCPNCKIELTEMGTFVDHQETITGRPAPKTRPATAAAERTFLKAVELCKAYKSDAVIGIQPGVISAEGMRLLSQNAGSLTFVDGEMALAKARMIKTPWEIEVLRTAAKFNEQAMNLASKRLHAGMSLAEAMNIYATTAYSMHPDVMGVFPTLTADENATIYFIAPDANLREGSVIRMDAGLVYLGYTTDICRIFSIGEPSDEQKRIYNAMAAGFRRELEMIGPGVKVSDIFNEVQDVVRKAGVPHYLRGHLGHSTGTTPHTEEYPYISASVDEVLQPGMVLCPEVPYYSPVNGPMVCEDMILITEDGFERFTHDPMQIVRI